LASWTLENADPSCSISRSKLRQNKKANQFGEFEKG
jgi:hypothetical protein